jgi:hypothetical protein
MKLSDSKPTEGYIKLLIKGVPGTRKTTQAATFPGPIFWFDIDRKVDKSLWLPRSLGAIPTGTEIEYEQYRRWYDIEKKLGELESSCPYKTVVLDSVTSIGDRINRQTLIKDKGGKRIGGIAVNTIEDYNAETSALMYMVDIANVIEANVIIIGHVIQRDQNIDGISKSVRQIVTGGKVVGAKIPAYIPEIYHFEFDGAFDTTQPPNYIMYTQVHGDDFARTGLPLPYKVDLTNKNLYEIITNAQRKLSTSDQQQLTEDKANNVW